MYVDVHSDCWNLVIQLEELAPDMHLAEILSQIVSFVCTNGQ